MAATLQRKSFGGIIFVIITKKITKIIVSGNYFVIISARMVSRGNRDSFAVSAIVAVSVVTATPLKLDHSIEFCGEFVIFCKTDADTDLNFDGNNSIFILNASIMS